MYEPRVSPIRFSFRSLHGFTMLGFLVFVVYAFSLSKIRILNQRKQQLKLRFLYVLKRTHDDKGVVSE
jgi:hypothetical protein